MLVFKSIFLILCFGIISCKQTKELEAVDYLYVPEGFNLKIDNVFLINLDRSIDRLEKMKQEFSKIDWNFERFPAVDGRTLSRESMEKQGQYAHSSDVSERKATEGEIGNYLSHYEVLKLGLARNYSNFVVIEDDARFVDNFQGRLNSLMAHTPPGWDIIYLSCFQDEKWGGNWKRLRRTENGRFSKLDKWAITGNAAYIVSQKGAKKLVDNMLPMRGQTDMVWSRDFVGGRYGEFNAYCALPELAVQDPNEKSIITKMGNRG